MTITLNTFLIGGDNDNASKPPHTHCWIHPTDAPIARAPYAPIIGPRRYHMNLGTRTAATCAGRPTHRKNERTRT